MLHELKLSYFRQHLDTRLQFVQGVNTIVGLNNSGKSTLPEAIEFAIYGSRALRDSAKGFITDGQTDGSAVVKLNLGEDDYIVGRNSRNAEVRKNGELDARYKDNVSTYMAQVTGVNQTGFRLGHYVRQKELAAFSSLRPGKRYETVERMLKVNAVDKAIKRLKEEINELEITQKTLLGSYQDVEAIENELDDLRLAHGSLCQRNETIRRDLETVSALLAEQRTLQKNLLKKPELYRLQRALSDCLQAQTLLSQVEEELARLGEVSSEAYQKLRDRANELRGLERQSIEMASTKRELDSLNPVKPEIVVEPVKPSKSPVTEAKTLLNAAEQKIVQFKALQDAAECDRCHQAIAPEVYKEILGNLTLESQAVADEYDRATVEYKTQESKWLDKMTDWDLYSFALQKYETDSARREQLLAKYVEVNFDASEQAQLDTDLQAMQTAREHWAKLDEQRTGLRNKVGEKSDIETHLEALAYLKKVEDDPQLDSVVAENETIERDLNKQLNDVSAEQAHTEGRTAELQRLVSNMKQTRDSINTNYTEIAAKKAMQDNFVLFKRHLTAKIRPLLQQVAEALFHKTTKDRYASFNLSNDYEITLTTHLGFTRKLSTISGSENDLACLCLRLAIATLRSTKLAGSLGFIILDEISGSFDDERTKQTLEGLLELRDVIPQIINITHKHVEMKYADRLFTVKEVNGTATVEVS